MVQLYLTYVQQRSRRNLVSCIHIVGVQRHMNAYCSEKVLCPPLPRMLLASSNTEDPSHLHTRCGPPVTITISNVGPVYLCWYCRLYKTRFFLIADTQNKHRTVWSFFFYAIHERSTIWFQQARLTKWYLI